MFTSKVVKTGKSVSRSLWVKLTCTGRRMEQSEYPRVMTLLGWANRRKEVMHSFCVGRSSETSFIHGRPGIHRKVVWSLGMWRLHGDVEQIASPPCSYIQTVICKTAPIYALCTIISSLPFRLLISVM